MSFLRDLVGAWSTSPTPFIKKILEEAVVTRSNAGTIVTVDSSLLRQGGYLAPEEFAVSVREALKQPEPQPETILERKPLLPKDLLVHTQKTEDPAKKTQEVVDRMLTGDQRASWFARGGVVRRDAIVSSVHAFASAIPVRGIEISTFIDNIYSTGRF